MITQEPAKEAYAHWCYFEQGFRSKSTRLRPDQREDQECFAFR